MQSDCMHAISGIFKLLQTSKFGFSVNRISNFQVWHAISGLWQTLSLVAVSSRLASLVAVCLHRDGKYATLEFGPIQYESPIACNPKCIQGRIGTSAGRGRFSRSSPKWPNFIRKLGFVGGRARARLRRFAISVDLAGSGLDWPVPGSS